MYVFFSFTYIKKLIHRPSLYRPNIADQHKVGFFTLDRCSQTEVTEVVDLKEMTEVLQILLQVMLVSSTTSVLKNQCPHYPVSSTSRLNVLMNIVYNTTVFNNHWLQQPICPQQLICPIHPFPSTISVLIWHQQLMPSYIQHLAS